MISINKSPLQERSIKGQAQNDPFSRHVPKLGGERGERRKGNRAMNTERNTWKWLGRWVCCVLLAFPVQALLAIESLETGIEYSTEVGEKNWEDFQNAKTAQDYGKIIDRMKELEARFDEDGLCYYATCFRIAFMESQFHLIDPSKAEQRDLYEYLLAQCQKIKTLHPILCRICTMDMVQIVAELEPLLVKKDAEKKKLWMKQRKANVGYLMEFLPACFPLLSQKAMDTLKTQEDKIAGFEMPKYEKPAVPYRHNWEDVHVILPEWVPDLKDRERYIQFLRDRDTTERTRNFCFRREKEFQRDIKPSVLFYLGNYYTDTPEDLRELREILEEHHITKDFQEEILKCVKTAE